MGESEFIKVVIYTIDKKIIVKDVILEAEYSVNYVKIAFKHSEDFLILDILIVKESHEWVKNVKLNGFLDLELFLLKRDLFSLPYIQKNQFRKAESSCVLYRDRDAGGE